MNIIACYKIVPEEQDIVIRADRTLSFDKAERKIGQYDQCAIEAAVKIKESVGGKVIGLSAGDKNIENSKLKKGALSRGLDELNLVVDESLADADTNQTAQVLAKSIRKMDSFDLILCGEGSSDLYAQQVGVQLGELLGITTVNAVSSINVDGNKVKVERTLEDEVEVLELTLPAVISVSADINLPRIPTMKEILAAGKKPTQTLALNDVEAATVARTVDVISTLAPEKAARKNIIFEGDSEEVVTKFLENLKKEL